jgi:glycosyltransferase involved in cell wall biosynthesis
LRIGIDGRYIQDHFPGIGRYTYNLVDALPTVAPEAQLVIMYNPHLLNTRYDMLALGRGRGVQLVPVGIPALSLKEQFSLPSLAKQLSLDLLHSPYYVKPYRLPCPSVVTFYDVIPLLYPQYLPSPWARWLFRLTARLALRSAAAVITVSESTRHDLLTRFGANTDKVWVTPLAADDRFRPLPHGRVEAVRHKYSLPQRYILYVGINKPHKNLVHLLEVFARLPQRENLVLAGREDQRYPQARQAAERLGLGDRAHFLGDVADDDLPALYNGASLFAFPSLYEGFGLPVLEAMACGTAVICSNTSSLPEIVGDAAIALDPTDRQAWVEAIGEVLRSEVLRDEMSQKSLQQAETFSWEKTARKTRHVYADILSSR